jgi:hypothetical protein
MKRRTFLGTTLAVTGLSRLVLGSNQTVGGSVTILDCMGVVLVIVPLKLVRVEKNKYVGTGGAKVVKSGVAAVAIVEIPGVPTVTAAVVKFACTHALVLDCINLIQEGNILINDFSLIDNS